MGPLELTQLGIALFPCRPDKSPDVPKGVDWASVASLTPPNSAIVGIPLEPPVYIIDLDTYKPGSTTTQALDAFFGIALPWGDAHLQTTRSGGKHYGFRVPLDADLRQGANLFKQELGEGFDTRVAGRGYIATGEGYDNANLVKLGYGGMLLPELPPQVVAKLLRPKLEASTQELPTGDVNVDQIRAALSYLDNDSRDDWRNVGFALRHQFHDDPDTGKAIWDDWSQNVPGYPGELHHKYDQQRQDDQWNSFKPQAGNGGPSITMGSIFHNAKKLGFIMPTRSVTAAEVFGNTAQPERQLSVDFNALLQRIRSEAGTDNSVTLLTAEIKALELLDSQRAEAVSVLQRCLDTAGQKVSKAELVKWSTPTDTKQATAQPLPPVCRFMDLPVAQQDYLDGNHGRSAALMIEHYFKDRLVQAEDGLAYWWNGQRFEPVFKENLQALVIRAYGEGEFAKSSNFSGTTTALSGQIPLRYGLGQTRRELYFQNGVMDPLTGEIAPHSPENNNTNVLSVSYDPAATAPEWDAFLADIFESEPERIDFLHELMGWLLCSDTLGIEKAALFYGAPRAGKGTIIEALIAIMGEAAAVPLRLAQLNRPKSLGAMFRAQLAFDSEAGDIPGREAPEIIANFKAISANEPMAVEVVYQQERATAKPNCKYLAACNRIPTMYDDSGAAPRRWLPLEFDKSFTDREDTGIKERITAEAPGIAARAVEGLRRFINSGYKFSLPASTVAKMEELKKAASPVAEFLGECVTYTPDGKVHGGTLFEAYRNWCVETGNKPLTRNRFTTALRDVTRADGRVEVAKSLRIAGKVSTGFCGLALAAPTDAKNVTPITPKEAFTK